MGGLGAKNCLPQTVGQSAAQRYERSSAGNVSTSLRVLLISFPPGIVGSIAKYWRIAALIPAKQVFALIQFCGLKTLLAGSGSFAAASRAVFRHVPAISTIFSTRFFPAALAWQLLGWGTPSASP